MAVERVGSGRLIIVSNRLPFTVRLRDDELQFDASAGGLVTGLSAFLDSYKDHFPKREEHVWVGWPGNTIPDEHKDSVRSRALNEYHAYPVFLTESEMEDFYLGFCNKTIWPLFHYFPSYTVYHEDFWQNYRRVNQLFCEALTELIKAGDTVWVQDYHLMLLPRLLREKFPGLLIGFFLHIPFPSFEIFQLLPPRWRRDILEGLLGADLIGFHTYEYMQQFLQSVLRFLGHEHHMGQISLPNHVVKVETYPMGIDFQRFVDTTNDPVTQQERAEVRKSLSTFRAVLSVDRLDYSKGILHRLEGFERLLEKYPDFREKVVLIMIVVPSRIGVQQYELMKKQIEEYVGRINGKFGSIGWMPVIYQYKHLSLQPLVALYGVSDVALVTPLRDGMNLIAKEYVASRVDLSGVLILSEMAGAAKELGEAIIVNPNDRDQIAEALKEALEMPLDEQKRRNQIMQQRLRRYDVIRWATDFVTQLAQMKEVQERFTAKLLTPVTKNQIGARFLQAHQRILFLDYDGTLVPLMRRPYLAVPTEPLLMLLRTLSSDPRTTVVLISGRDRATLERWFGDLSIGIIAEHGIWLRDKSNNWQMLSQHSADWKARLLPMLQQYADRLPGAFVEEKEHSLVWHYRVADPEQARPLAAELTDHLVHFTANIDIQVLQGSKVVEIRNAGVNKGNAAVRWLSTARYDLIIAIGDDWTDEDLFTALPESAVTLRVGLTNTRAQYNIPNSAEVIELLKSLCQLEGGARGPAGTRGLGRPHD
jgi:trehalose 6-phosphate synthase/phosphatase